jgi:hypothetical protein
MLLENLSFGLGILIKSRFFFNVDQHALIYRFWNIKNSSAQMAESVV